VTEPTEVKSMMTKKGHQNRKSLRRENAGYAYAWRCAGFNDDSDDNDDDAHITALTDFLSAEIDSGRLPSSSHFSRTHIGMENDLLFSTAATFSCSCLFSCWEPV